MNLLLHGIGKANGPELIEVHDSLAEKPRRHATLVLANPPFGRKSGFSTVDEFGRVTRDDDSYEDSCERDDFWVTTSNKQLNFVQHIYRLLTIDGRAAVVVPDNVLFEGGAGEQLVARDKANLDITWLRDPDAEDSDNLPPPEVIAQEIVDDLQAALNEFAAVAEALETAKTARQDTR